MTLETKHSLCDATIGQLQNLIQINTDSSESLEKLASNTDVIAVANLFRSLSGERGEQAAELQKLVESNDEEARESGSLLGAARQALIDIRAALGGDQKVMLIEAEKCEDKIKEAYEQVLSERPGTAVSDVLHRQYAAVKAAHDRVRDLRDACQGEGE